MPTFKGNAGHLMQHWPLCKMLEVAAHQDKGVPGLNFIDAYAMAPLATETKFKDAKFQNAENRLPKLGDSASAYERAWYKLTSGHCPEPREGYPSSAAFVEQVWKGDFSMLLCEIDPATCQEIEPWLQRVDNSKKCKTTELFPDDWRKRFKKGLPSPASARLADGSLTLVLFDPYICSKLWSLKRTSKRSLGNLYIRDIEMATGAMADLDGGILLQFSTYSADGGNRQKDVIASMNSVLKPKGFALIAVVRLNGHMMSLVYARNVSWAAELADILGGFDNWFSKI